MQDAKVRRLKEKLHSELGAELLSYLSDPAILEIMLNPDGRIWIEHKTLGLCATLDEMSPIVARQLLGTIADFSGSVINEAEPILETILPFTRYRFQGLIPPVVSAPCFAIRKFSAIHFSLQDYIDQDRLTLEQGEFIREAITLEDSILIAGGPGSGKTTFANALLNEMVLLGNANQRFVIIEDTPELRCLAANTVFLKTSATCDHSQLLRATLRLRPNKICLGECRGKEMLTLLKAWNTGTPGGLTTIHSNSAESALIRVVEMAEESGSAVSPYFICESIQLIVSMADRRIREIKRLVGYQEDRYVFETI